MSTTSVTANGVGESTPAPTSAYYSDDSVSSSLPVLDESSLPIWNTRLTSDFPSMRVPIMAAPMADVSGGRLAAAVCAAGALGFISGGHLISAEAVNSLEREIDIFRDESPDDAPLCLGFICHSSLRDPKGWRRMERFLSQHKPDVVQFSFPAILPWHTERGTTTNVDMVRECVGGGCRVVAQVGSEEEARAALEAGVDWIVAQVRRRR